MSGACSALATGRPGIAVPPGLAHFSPRGNKKQTNEEKQENMVISMQTLFFFTMN